MNWMVIRISSGADDVAVQASAAGLANACGMRLMSRRLFTPCAKSHSTHMILRNIISVRRLEHSCLRP
jgi:hypothetical protein